MRFAVAIGLSVLLPATLLAQDPGADLAAGLRQIEEGDFAAATITLDRAARGLASANRTHELAQAYLNLGIAYLGLGSETSAKARFRDALAQARDLRLDPAQFSPKVIEVFEKARAEGSASTPSAPARLPSSAGATSSKRSKAPLILVGVAGVAAAGVAVAAGGGGSPATTVAASTNTTDTITGLISGGCGPSDTISHRFVPARSGTLDALVSWSPQGPVLTMYISSTRGGAERLASSSPASNTSARLTFAVQNQEYWALVEQRGGGPCVSYTLTLSYPH